MMIYLSHADKQQDRRGEANRHVFAKFVANELRGLYTKLKYRTLIEGRAIDIE